MLYSFKGLTRFASFWLILSCILAGFELQAQNYMASTVLLCPLAPLEDTTYRQYVEALKLAGLKRANIEYRPGCETRVDAAAQVQPTAPEDIRSQLLKARQHYENLETEALNQSLQTLEQQMQRLANPYLFKDLFGAYLLLRSESALIQEDSQEARSYLGLYARILGPEKKINAALYTPTLRTMFEEVLKTPVSAKGILRVRYPGGVLQNARIAVDLNAQTLEASQTLEITLPVGLHTLTLQAAEAMPALRFLKIQPDQVTEIQWHPQAVAAAQQREQWRAVHQKTSPYELSRQAINSLRVLQPGLNVIVMQGDKHLLVTPTKRYRISVSSNKAQWARDIKSRLTEIQTPSEPSAAGLSSGLFMGHWGRCIGNIRRGGLYAGR